MLSEAELARSRKSEAELARIKELAEFKGTDRRSFAASNYLYPSAVGTTNLVTQGFNPGQTKRR